jgi:hypothetical protein
MSPAPIPIDRVEVHLTDQQRRRLSYLRRAERYAEAEMEEMEYNREALRQKALGRLALKRVQLVVGL